MTLKWGSTEVTAVKWGSTNCTAVYWGSTLVWPTNPVYMLTNLWTGVYGYSKSGDSYLGCYSVNSGNSSQVVQVGSTSSDAEKPVYNGSINGRAKITTESNGALTVWSNCSSGGSGHCLVITNQKISLSNIKKITVTFSAMSNVTTGRMHFGYSTNNTVTHTDGNTSSATFAKWGNVGTYIGSASVSSTSYVLTLTSAISGDYYIGFDLSAQTYNTTASCTITNLTFSAS